MVSDKKYMWNHLFLLMDDIDDNELIPNYSGRDALIMYYKNYPYKVKK